jgi:hypothetical protein
MSLRRLLSSSVQSLRANSCGNAVEPNAQRRFVALWSPAVYGCNPAPAQQSKSQPMTMPRPLDFAWRFYSPAARRHAALAPLLESS